MASTISRGVSEYSGAGSKVASKETLLSGPILASRDWARVLAAAEYAWFRSKAVRYRENAPLEAVDAGAAVITSFSSVRYNVTDANN